MSSRSDRAVRALALGFALTLAGVAAPLAPVADDALPFTADQVKTGSQLYAQHCAECHGARLQGVSAPPLQFGADEDQSVRSLFKFAVDHMPPSAPHGLRDDEYVALLAYIASENGYAPAARALTFDQAKTTTARFPRRPK